ncbi:hypothetical protein, partial [Tenacibaculum sp. 190524A02b]
MKNLLIIFFALFTLLLYSQKSINICTQTKNIYKEKNNIKRVPLKSISFINTKAYTQSIHNAIATWNIPGAYRTYAIGTKPGKADIEYYGGISYYLRNTPGASYQELKKSALKQGTIFNISDTFYISLWNGEGNDLISPDWISPPLKFEWENLGSKTNKLEINIETKFGVANSTPFTLEQQNKIKDFLDKVTPIILDVYGPPARNSFVDILNDEHNNDKGIYYKKTNTLEIKYSESKGDFSKPRLLVHEILHAYRDNVILTANSEWNHDDTLSGFEEGMVESAAIIIMDKFIEHYPTFFSDLGYRKYWSSVPGMAFDWDYDFQNHSQLTTTDFFSSGNSTGAAFERYGTAQTCMQKMYIENSNVFKDFNQEYYNRLNSNHDLSPTKELIVSIFEKILPKVEQTPIKKWINEQHILDCKVTPGNKVHLFTYHPSPASPRIRTLDNRIHIYQTQDLPGGNEWTWIEMNTSDNTPKYRWFNQTNNLDGVLNIYNYKNTINQSINIKNNKKRLAEGKKEGIGPYQGYNHYTYNGIYTAEDGENDCTQPGCGKRPDYTETHSFYSTSHNSKIHQDIPTDFPDPSSQIITGLEEFGLYRYDISFEEGKFHGTYYRLHGLDLVKTDGIFGGIKSIDKTKLIKGKLIFEHEKYGEEEEITIKNGGFLSKRKWASVPVTNPNRKGGRNDTKRTKPGRTSIIYISEDCTEQKIDFRNVTYGDNLTGSHLFLFTVENFEDIVFTPSDDVSICKDE